MKIDPSTIGVICTMHSSPNQPKYGPFLWSNDFNKLILEGRVFPVDEWNERGGELMVKAHQSVARPLVVSIVLPKEEVAKVEAKETPKPVKEQGAPKPATVAPFAPAEAEAPKPEPEAGDAKDRAVEIVAGPLHEVIPRIEASTDAKALTEALTIEKRKGALEAIEERIQELNA